MGGNGSGSFVEAAESEYKLQIASLKKEIAELEVYKQLLFTKGAMASNVSCPRVV